MKKYFGPLLVVVFLLALLEVISRVILYEIYNRKFDQSLIEANKYLTSPGLKENANGVVWGRMFHTDQFGCRLGPRKYSSSKKKWLFIGDSVTEGVGVDDSATFAAIVAARTDSVDIMNYSLIGYSDADYLNILKTLLPRADSAISRVTIFFCLNDVYGVAKTGQLPVMARNNIAGRLNGWLQNSYATYTLVKLLVYQNSDRYYRYDEQFYKNNNPYFNDAMQRLRQCDSVCRVAGVQMNVVMLPYRSQLTGGDEWDNKPQLLVKDFCLHNNIAFDAITATSAGISASVSGSILYLFADEIHFSKAGHKKVADYILTH